LATGGYHFVAVVCNPLTPYLLDPDPKVPAAVVLSMKSLVRLGLIPEDPTEPRYDDFQLRALIRFFSYFIHL
jgi:hypothetical protein